MEEGKIFHCPAGNFRGINKKGTVELKGIRYADAARFEPPVPFSYSDATVDCFSDSPFSVQNQPKIETYLFDVDYDVVQQVESPLFLSLTIPENASADDKLPVMVWIHGGAYKNGGCDASYLDRTYLVNEGGVIVVGINYRLSVFGFVKNKSGNFANLGLLDIIEGLKWVKNNISSFGGDPDNVTLFGQSAGADAIRCVMLSEGTEPLYKRAIIQSDPIAASVNRQALEKGVLDSLNRVAVDAPSEEYKRAIEEIVENVTEKGNAKHVIFAPHAGVYPMVAECKFDEKLRNVAKDHELLIGWNLREISVYVARNKTMRKLDKCFLTKGLINAVIKMKSREIFGKGSKEFARKFASFGGSAAYYEFSWTENGSFLGACHTLDLALLFGGQTMAGHESAMGLSVREIAEKGVSVRKIWTDFAKTGIKKSIKIPNVISIEKL